MPYDGGGDSVGTWSDACLGDPEVREDYDLGGTVVRMCGVCFYAIARFVSECQVVGTQVSRNGGSRVVFCGIVGFVDQDAAKASWATE